MKTNKKMVNMMFINILTAGLFTFAVTSCKDDLNLEDTKNASLEINSLRSLENLEQHSYSVPFEVTAKGDWRIDFVFNENHQICYALPNHGNGPTTVKICVLDNWTNERRTGEMTITDFTNSTKQTIKMGQKGNKDRHMTRGNVTFNIPEKGNRIYGVGYGYNEYLPVSEAISMNPIIKVEEVKEENIFVTGGVDTSECYMEATGSTFREMTNDFKTKACVKGEGFGFAAEASAAFNRKDFSQSKYEYALCVVDITKTKAELVNVNLSTIMQKYMCDEAYSNINGIPFQMKDARPGRAVNKTVAYPSTDEGMYELIKAYGTHLVVRTDMGGRVTFANTVDVSQVEGNYDIKAFAKCSYKNAFVSANAEVSDDYSKSFKNNTKAVSTIISAYGGTQETSMKVSSGTKESIDAWRATLNDVGNCKIVRVDQNTLIPLWKLVNVNEDGGADRQKKLKDFMETRLYTMMQREQMKNSYAAGTIAHISNLPKFPAASETSGTETLIKDVYLSGKHVARICNEYLPNINKKERVTVVYPVVENNVKYNLGYWIGDENRKPCRVCCTDNGITINEVSDEKVGQKKELFLRGSCFYSKERDAELLKKEQTAKTTIEDAYMLGMDYKGRENEVSRQYPIVKIFGRIWTRTWYNEFVSDKNYLIKETSGWYTPSSDLNFKINNWRTANYDDFENLKNGLQNGGITLPATVMHNDKSNQAEDITGFNIQWDGWTFFGFTIDMTNNGAKDQIEYMTRNSAGTEIGHVRIMKGGSMEIVKGEQGNWGMRVRLALPLSKQK